MNKMYVNTEERMKFKNNCVDFVKENFEQNQLFSYIKKDRERLLKKR